MKPTLLTAMVPVVLFAFSSLPRSKGERQESSSLAVVLATTESDTDWSRLSELLPRWYVPAFAPVFFFFRGDNY